MKAFGPSRALGLSFGDRSVRAVEVVGRERAVKRAAEWTLPAGISLEEPEALGSGLREFLRSGGFAARRTVVGLPARWLLTRSREISPMTPELAGSAIRLLAERDLALDSKDLALDFAGDADPSEARTVLMVAIQRRSLELISRAAKAAGLRLAAVTSTTLALSRAARGEADERVMVSLAPEGAEVLLRRGSSLLQLRHVAGPSGADLGPLGGEIRRMVSLLPSPGGEKSPESPPPQGLVLWDGIGIDPAAAALLAERSGLEVRVRGDLRPLGLEADSGTAKDAKRFAAPAALALAGLERGLAPFDLLRSRCDPPRERRFGRKSAWGAAAALVLIAAGAFYVHDLNGREAELTKLKSHLQQIQPELQEAKKFAGRMGLVQGWYKDRPPVLGFLKQITLAFPEEGKVWTTNLTIGENLKVSLAGRTVDQNLLLNLRESLKGQISGRALDQNSILSVRDRLKKDPTFTSVTGPDMAETGGVSGGTTFTMKCTFRGDR